MYKKRKFKRRYFRKRGGGVYGRIKKLEKKVGNMKVAMKTIDNEQTGLSCATTGSVTCLGPMLTLADGEDKRDGNEVNVTSLQFTGEISSANMSHDNQCIRVILVIDKQSQGTDNSPTIVGDTITPLPNGYLADIGNDHIAFRYLDNMKRFKCLYDKLFRLSDTEGKTNVVFRFYKKFKKPIKVHYISDSNVEAAVGNNAFYLLLVGNQSTNPPTAKASWRFKFYDM